MTAAIPTRIPFFPARPLNGGPWEKAKDMPRFGKWLYEAKYNGWRILVHVPTGTAFNRKGEPLSIASEFAKAIAELQSQMLRPRPIAAWARDMLRDEFGVPTDPLDNPETWEWADMEGLSRRHTRGKGTLVLLDLPNLPLPLEQRGYVMRNLFCPALDHCASNDTVYSVPQCTDPQARWSELKLDNKSLGCEFYEGLVAKRADSLYPKQRISPDREFSGWVKHRWRF